MTESSFWSQLVEIDRQQQREPRGLPRGLQDLFPSASTRAAAQRRRRCVPPSVRFLGRRVYAAAIVVLPTMFTLRCGAARRGGAGQTLDRWSAWWMQTLPATTWWRQMRGRFDPPVDATRLPASVLQRC